MSLKRVPSERFFMLQRATVLAAKHDFVCTCTYVRTVCVPSFTLSEWPLTPPFFRQLFQHFLSYYAHYDYSVPIDVLTGATPLHRKLVKITKSLTNSWSPSPTNTPSSPPDSPPPTAAVTILCPLTANNLTASLSPQTSHCLHYALAEGHRHLTAITEWWDESTNTPRGQTGTPMTTPMSDREPTGPATARSTPLSPLRNPSSSSSSNGNANTITSPTSFSSSLRAPSLNPPTLTIPSNDDGGDDDPGEPHTRTRLARN